MSRWQITSPPLKPASPPKPRRPLRNIIICDCGRPAVAIAQVHVGYDITYTINLFLCKTCLAYEQESGDVPPPISIIYLT